jgi:hypothetical protein
VAYLEAHIHKIAFQCCPSTLASFLDGGLLGTCSRVAENADRMAKNISIRLSLKTAAFQPDGCFSGSSSVWMHFGSENFL